MKWQCTKCGQAFDTKYIGHFKTANLWKKWKSTAPCLIPNYSKEEFECDGKLVYIGEHQEVIEFFKHDEYMETVRGFVREIIHAHPDYYPSEAACCSGEDGHAEIDRISFCDDTVFVTLTLSGHEGENELSFDLEDVLVETRRKTLINKLLKLRDKMFSERMQERKDRKDAKLQQEIKERKELERLKKKYEED